VWAWGYNETSSLGDGTATNRSVPIQVNLAQATSVAAGGYHSLATLENGTAMAWGYNGVAQLGDRSRLNRSTPVPVYGLTNAYRVSAGWVHSVALRNDGSVWAWGHNAQQQAGGAPSPDRLTAGPVSCGVDLSCPRVGGSHTLGKISWISSGSSLHTLVLADNGTVWGWGWNALGQLGNGTLNNSGVPVKATNLVTGDIAAALYHSLYRT
jgi:alpha-tubulin suppressor-like RCC1 family protein